MAFSKGVKLAASVGKGGSNGKFDVLLVQIALTDVRIPVTTGGVNSSTLKISHTTLWHKSSWSGLNSTKLINAIKLYQNFYKLKATGKIEPKSRTFNNLLKDSQKISKDFFFGHVDKQDYAIMSTRKWIKIQGNGKVEANRILLREPLFNKEAESLGDVVTSAATLGLEVSVSRAFINRITGCLEISLALAFSYGADFFFFDISKAIKVLQKIIQTNADWNLLRGGDNLILRIKSSQAYPFLKVGTNVPTQDFFRVYLVPLVGLSKAQYINDSIVKTIVDAIYQQMVFHKSSTGKPVAVYKKLLEILYIKIPNITLGWRSILLTHENVSTKGREIAPLYASTIKFTTPVSLATSIGFSLQRILNPNTRKEYVYFEIVPMVGLSLGASFGRFEPIEESISDFESFSVSFFKNAEWNDNFGAYSLEYKWKDNVGSPGEPQFHYRPSIGELKDDTAGAFSKELKETLLKPEIIIFSWDLGVAELILSRKRQAEVSTNIEFAAGAKLKFFLSVEETNDEHLYSQIPSHGTDFLKY